MNGIDDDERRSVNKLKRTGCLDFSDLVGLGVVAMSTFVGDSC
jgi:hypothetical protein